MSYSRPFIRSLRSFVSDTRTSYFWAWMDIKCRYRRSALGPFWETVNMTIMILGMAFVSGALFNVPIKEMLPFLGLGIIFWSVIANSINEGASCFISHSNLLKNSNSSIGFYVGRTILRVYITAAHHLVIYILAVIFLNVDINANTLLGIPGIFLLFLNSLWIAPTLGFICARYRDFEMIVRNITQLLFFVTPIFWNPDIVSSDKRIIIDLNPFYYFLEIVRAPLLGKTPSLQVYLVVLLMTFTGYLIFSVIYKIMRSRLVFYT